MNRSWQLICVFSGLAVVTACGAQNPVTSSPVAATSEGLLAAKGKPPTPIPVTVAFRCPGPACSGGDRFMGDGGSYAAQLDSGGNLGLSLESLGGGRTLSFDYTDCVSPCVTGRRWFTAQTVTAANSFWLHTSVLVPGTESETPRGFLDIPVGATWFSRIKFSYHVPGATGVDLGWGHRFNPFFPGSTNLTVSRPGENLWLVEAGPTQTAWMVSVAGRKDGGEVFEGNYLMPFQLAVTR